MDAGLWRLLADAILVLHFGVVLFVVCGLVYILAGNRYSWRGANNLRFRVLHLAAIGVVVLQAWLGAVCPLTALENWARDQAGAEGYAHGFVQHWIQRLLFYEAPAWVFTVAYTLFGLLVAWAWWRFPAVSRRET